MLGVLAGAVVATAVLQSSSATTVMAIGFVSARLMTMRQAIAVIFGANIGTTMTAQLMAFKTERLHLAHRVRGLHRVVHRERRAHQEHRPGPCSRSACCSWASTLWAPS
ncbi:Na/Pi symporter [Paraeggerthella sp.]|uniref:Na/Pi symporter n=1 Tax=Paraeggerthella sp. TaxID=2897350 RepID=UPI0035282D79